jgi:hypothetical protein
MLEFRRSLPAFKARDALLKAISENQVKCVIHSQYCRSWLTVLPIFLYKYEFAFKKKLVRLHMRFRGCYMLESFLFVCLICYRHLFISASKD